MRLERTTFATSRLLEFFTQRELTVQLGRPMHLWPITIIKELIDNGLDASETAGRPPEIEIGIGNESFSVKGTRRRRYCDGLP